MQKYTALDVLIAAKKHNVVIWYDFEITNDITKINLSNGVKRTTVCVSPATRAPFRLSMVCGMVINAIEDIVRCTAESKEKVKPVYVGRGKNGNVT